MSSTSYTSPRSNKIFNICAPPFAKLYLSSTWDITKVPDLTGKVAVVTGANTGLGYQSALVMAQHGAKVLVLARSEEKGKSAVERIKRALAAEGAKVEVEFWRLDLADLNQTKQTALSILTKYPTISILINNAGLLDAHFHLTPAPYNLETHFGINHVGTFLFTTTLLPALSQPGTRIVNVTSYGHVGCKNLPLDIDKINDPNLAGGSWLDRYALSKLCNVLFTKELQRRVGDGVYVNCVNPGQVRTELNREVEKEGFQGFMIRLIMKLFDQPVEVGVLTHLYLATAEEVEEKGIRGRYYWNVARDAEEFVNPLALDGDLAKWLWEFTETLVEEKLRIVEGSD